MPFMLLIVFGIIDFGAMYNDITNSDRVAGRCPPRSSRQWVLPGFTHGRILPGLGSHTVDEPQDRDPRAADRPRPPRQHHGAGVLCEQPTPGVDHVTVNLSYTANSLTGFLSYLNNITQTSKSIMRLEQMPTYTRTRRHARKTPTAARTRRRRHGADIGAASGHGSSPSPRSSWTSRPHSRETSGSDSR